MKTKLKLKDTLIYNGIKLLSDPINVAVDYMEIKEIKFLFDDNGKLNVSIKVEYGNLDSNGNFIPINTDDEEIKYNTFILNDNDIKALSETPLSPNERSGNIYIILRNRIFSYFKSINII